MLNINFSLMTAFNFLSLGFENLVAYQIKLFHVNYDILNCYQLSDGPERLGRSEYLQFIKILGNYCSMCSVDPENIHTPTPQGITVYVQGELLPHGNFQRSFLGWA